MLLLGFFLNKHRDIFIIDGDFFNESFKKYINRTPKLQGFFLFFFPLLKMASKWPAIFFNSFHPGYFFIYCLNLQKTISALFPQMRPASSFYFHVQIHIPVTHILSPNSAPSSETDFLKKMQQSG